MFGVAVSSLLLVWPAAVALASDATTNQTSRDLHYTSVVSDGYNMQRALGTAKVKWESWKHKKDPDEILVNKLQEASAGVSALAGPEPEDKLRGKAKQESAGEERSFTNFLAAETANPALNVWGRWAHESAHWLSREVKMARSDLAFGVLTTVAGASRLGLLKHWWCVIFPSEALF